MLNNIITSIKQKVLNTNSHVLLLYALLIDITLFFLVGAIAIANESNKTLSTCLLTVAILFLGGITTHLTQKLKSSIDKEYEKKLLSYQVKNLFNKNPTFKEMNE